MSQAPDSQSKFSLASGPAGTYALSASKPGFDTLLVRVKLNKTEKDVQVRLLKLIGSYTMKGNAEVHRESLIQSVTVR